MQTGPVEPGVLGARLRQQQSIEDPSHGESEPLALEARSVLWPHAAQWALIELVSVTASGARRLEEYRFTPAEGTVDAPSFAGPGLPVAVLFERTPNGASRARMYSTPGLRNRYRRSLGVDSHLQPERDSGDVLARLAAAAHDGDLEGTLAVFETDGWLQPPDGAVHRGQAELAGALRLLYGSGERSVRYCTQLNEGTRSALEVQLASERPALIVCERSAHDLLAAVRLYA